MLKWRRGVLKQEHKHRQRAAKIGRATEKELARIAKSDLSAVLKTRSILRLTNEYVDSIYDLQDTALTRASKEAADEAYRMMNLMLPVGVEPPGDKVTLDPMNTVMKGATPAERIERLRIKARKRMGAVYSRRFVEAPRPPVLIDEEEAVLAEFTSVESYAEMLCGNDLWLGNIFSLATTFDEASGGDILDHWEHLATLDAVTCDECAALDGRVIPVASEAFGGEDNEPWEAVEVHPNCRCVPIPVTKTWDELGFEGVQDPEGSRISRPSFEGRASPEGYIDEQGKRHPFEGKYDANGALIGDNHQPGWQPYGGNQEYVPSDTRYLDWTKGRYGE